MPGWKGLSWVYGWSWLQLATSTAGMAENELLCHRFSCGTAKSCLLVPLVPLFTGRFLFSAPRCCHLPMGACSRDLPV